MSKYHQTLVIPLLNQGRRHSKNRGTVLFLCLLFKEEQEATSNLGLACSEKNRFLTSYQSLQQATPVWAFNVCSGQMIEAFIKSQDKVSKDHELFLITPVFHPESTAATCSWNDQCKEFQNV